MYFLFNNLILELGDFGVAKHTTILTKILFINFLIYAVFGFYLLNSWQREVDKKIFGKSLDVSLMVVLSVSLVFMVTITFVTLLTANRLF